MMTVTTTITMDEGNIQKFIKLYGEGNGDFSLSLVIPEPDYEKEKAAKSSAKKTASVKKKSKAKKNSSCEDWYEWRIENWGTKTDAMDYGDGLALHDVLCGDLNFQTAWNLPIKIFEKMAADGLEFDIYWEAEDVAELGIGKGKAKDGKFWHCIDFNETAERYRELTDEEWDPRDCAFVNHVDEYGNNCEIDTSRVLVYANDFLIVPVKKILETGSELDCCADNAYKIPPYFRSVYEIEDWGGDIEYSDYLRYSGDSDDVFLLDKKGNKIKSLYDFDHSEKDENGYVYYPVPCSDMKNDCLTKTAEEKWRKKLKIK